MPASPSRPLAPAVLDGFRRGDRQAFFAIYEAYAAEVRAVAARYFASPFEREEAVQEIWLNVHNAAGRYDESRGGLLPWLRAVAANRCLQVLRSAGRHTRPAAPLEEDDLVTFETPATATHDERVQTAVRAFASKLPDDERAVFEGAFAGGERHEEGARRLGISLRRYKYLKKKVLEKAAVAPELAEVLR